MTTDDADARFATDAEELQDTVEPELTVNLTVMNQPHDPLPYATGRTAGQYLKLAGIPRLRRNQRLSIGGQLADPSQVVQPGQTIVVAPRIRNG